MEEKGVLINGNYSDSNRNVEIRLGGGERKYSYQTHPVFGDSVWWMHGSKKVFFVYKG